MLCPKCLSETEVKKEYKDDLAVTCRRRRCKRGHWFDTRQVLNREKLVGDVLSLRTLVLKQKLLHGKAGAKMLKLILGRHAA